MLHDHMIQIFLELACTKLRNGLEIPAEVILYCCNLKLKGIFLWNLRNFLADEKVDHKNQVQEILFEKKQFH